MTRAEYARRLRIYERGRQWALAVGALPLLGVYLVVHTPWLKPVMQDHKHLVVVLLITLPLGCLFAATQVWRRWGPHWLGLACPGCVRSGSGHAAPDDGLAARCPRCDHLRFDPEADAG